MKSALARMASILALIAVISAVAYGTASATTIIFGTFKYDGDSTNYYDPANGYVLAGFGGPLVTVGAGVEFGFQDFEHGTNLVTANFDFNAMSILGISSADAAPWTQTFTAHPDGFFNGLTLINDTFLNGVTYSVVGNTLTVSWGGTVEPHTGTVFFAFDRVAPVPLPAALPLFATILAGGGLIAWRRRRKAAKLATH